MTAPGEPQAVSEPVYDKAGHDFAWQMAETAEAQRNQAWSLSALLLGILCQANRSEWRPYLVVDLEQEQTEPVGAILYLDIPDMPKAGLFPGCPGGLATFPIQPRDMDYFNHIPYQKAPLSRHAAANPPDAWNLLTAYQGWRCASEQGG